MKLVRYADLRDLRELLSGMTFPEYMHHNEPGHGRGPAVRLGRGFRARG